MEKEFIYHNDQSKISEMIEVQEMLAKSSGINYVIKEHKNGFTIIPELANQSVIDIVEPLVAED